jgi:hypothetical protein
LISIETAEAIDFTGSILVYCMPQSSHDFILDRRTSRPAGSRRMSVTGG